ncbi:MAG TPA: hypothetical protein VF661_14880 [Actinomycetales bacterium]|jgi:hypothetical protein
MRIDPVVSTAWSARYPLAGAPVDPVAAADLDAMLSRQPYSHASAHQPGAGHDRRRPQPADGPVRPVAVDVREGRVLPDMTVEQFRAYARSGQGTALGTPGAGDEQVHAYGHRYSYGPSLVIDLTDSSSTIDLRA